MAIDTPTDGNVNQWDKLKNMRLKRDGTLEAPADRDASGKFVSPEKIKEEQEKLQSGEPVGGKVEEPVAAEPDAPDNDDDDDDDPETDALPVAAKSAEPATEKPAVATAPPGTEAVEIDGRTVYVDPSLAAAYRANETHKAASKDAETHAKLVDDVATRVAERFPTSAPQIAPVSTQKSAAEIAAEKAIKEAEDAVAIPQPPSSLQLSNPEEYDRQMKLHIEDAADRKVKRALAEKDRRDAEAARDQNARIEAQREQQAYEILGGQFYAAYPVLAKPETKELVDLLLNKKWDEMKGRMATFTGKLTPAEAAALKTREFEAVAAEATRKIVAIRGNNNAQAAPPAPPPPALNTSTRATKTAKAATPPPAKVKEKYPSGSMSSILKSHQAKKMDATA